MPRMTQSDYAKHRGIKKQAVWSAIKEGVVILDADRLVDVEQSDARWSQLRGEEPTRLAESRAKPKRRDPDEGDGGETRAEAETRKARAAADLAELKAAELRGELVAVSDVKPRIYARARALRDRLQVMCATVVSAVRAADSTAEGRRLLEAAVRKALQESADDTPDAIEPDGEP